MHKFIESFQIINLINKQAYWLALPAHYRIHNVFYVSYLKSHKCCLNNNSLSELLFLDLINNEKKYKIKDILNKKWRREQLQYKVKWVEYLTEYNEWLWVKHMKNAEVLQQEYDAKAERKQKHKWDLRN